ncbi:MAG: hypothetical protein ACP5FX_00155 [Candidatus Micrarchaeia archaeon]
MKMNKDFEDFLFSLASSQSIKEALEKEIKKDYKFSTELRKAYFSFLSGEKAEKAFSKLISKGGEEGEAFMLIAHSLESGENIQKALLRICEYINIKKKLEIENERKLGLIKFSTIASSSFIFPLFSSIIIYSFSKISSISFFTKAIVLFYILISSSIDSIFLNKRFIPFLSVFVFFSSLMLLRVVL